MTSLNERNHAALASGRLRGRVETYESPRIDRPVPHSVQRDPRWRDQIIAAVWTNDRGGLLEAREHAFRLEDELLRRVHVSAEREHPRVAAHRAHDFQDVRHRVTILR